MVTKDEVPVETAGLLEKGMLKKPRKVSSPGEISDDEGRRRHKRSPKDRRKKKRYSSSDSSSSSSADSGSDSDSDSSVSDSESDDSSSSSGGRRRKRKRSSKGIKPVQKKSGHSKKRNGRSGRSRRKSKRSSDSSSESETTSSRSASGDEEPKRHKSSKLDKKSSVSGEDQRKDRAQKTVISPSMAEGDVSQKTERMSSNGHGKDSQSARVVEPAVDIEKNRGQSRSPRRSQENLPSDSEITDGKASAKPKDDDMITAPEGVPPQGKEPEKPSGPIRKGRGFTEKFAFVRKYRGHSPELRGPHNFGGRNYYNRNRDRTSTYRDREPYRRYRSPPRRRSPRSRRSRSRSGSPSDRGPRRHRSRSPVRGTSPGERRPISERLGSRRGTRADERRSPVRAKSRSRSRGRASRSSSPDVSLPRHRRKRSSVSPRKSPSRSPVAQKGLVAYGDGSPDAGSR